MQKKSKLGRILFEFVEYYFYKYINGEYRWKEITNLKRFLKSFFSHY